MSLFVQTCIFKGPEPRQRTHKNTGYIRNPEIGLREPVFLREHVLALGFKSRENNPVSFTGYRLKIPSGAFRAAGRLRTTWSGRIARCDSRHL